MLILGLLLIVVGALAILAAVATATTSSGGVEYLGTDISALALFLVGVGAGVAILWGFTISKFGTQRSLQHRRERRKLTELSEKLDQVEAERHEGDARHRDRDGDSSTTS